MRRFIHCSTTLYLGFVIAGLAAAGPPSNCSDPPYLATKCYMAKTGGNNDNHRNLPYQVNNGTVSPGNRGETGGTLANGRRNTAFTNLNSSMSVDEAYTQVMSHEIGHTFGLDDCSDARCPVGTSVMRASAPLNDIGSPEAPSMCDQFVSN